jgi:Xaa-Pro aminopeptidase
LQRSRKLVNHQVTSQLDRSGLAASLLDASLGDCQEATALSTEIHVGDVFLNVPEGPDLGETEISTDDRVRQTSDDRPRGDALPHPVDPAADHLDPELAKRRADVDEKHRRVGEFLERAGYEAVIFRRAEWISWFTAGGDLHEHLTGETGSIALFVNRHARAVVADNVQTPRIFEEELAGLGFHLKERPWHEPIEPVVAALTRGKKVATDSSWPALGLPDESDRLRPLRLTLTKLERQRLRELGRTLALAVEATCRNFDPGETEADVAGHLAHRLLRESVVPVGLSIAGDDRLLRHRQPGFKAAPIRRRAVITATGRRQGLHASLTRIVSFGTVEEMFRRTHGLATMVDATYIYFSRPDEPVTEVFRRARRILEKNNRPHEWSLDYQGFITGYSPREYPLRPDSAWKLHPDMALCWSPSVGPSRSGDTIVLDARGGYEVVTEAQHWPKIEILVKGYNLPRPGILER